MNYPKLSQAIDYLVEKNILYTDKKAEFIKLVYKCYNEPHRFYHNLNHIEYMIGYPEIGFPIDNDIILYYISVILHDIIYYPNRTDNEEKSVEMLNLLFNQNYFNISKDDKESIANAIMLTKHHRLLNNYTLLETTLIEADMSITNNSNINERMKWHYGIFKEYQMYPYPDFKYKRLEFLKSCNNEDIEYVNDFVPKVALYAGSFNPFHVGHLDVLKKAEKLFDKVIIAVGINIEKTAIYLDNYKKLKKILPFHEVIYYSNTLQNLYDTLSDTGIDVTLIRGIRNSTDLLYEQNLDKFVKRPMIYIPAAHNIDHISSSGIRSLASVDKNAVEEYLVKDFEYIL